MRPHVKEDQLQAGALGCGPRIRINQAPVAPAGPSASEMAPGQGCREVEWRQAGG